MNLSDFRQILRLIHRVKADEVVLIEHEDAAIREALAYHSLQLPCLDIFSGEAAAGIFRLTDIPGWGVGYKVLGFSRMGVIMPRSLWVQEGNDVYLAHDGPIGVKYSSPHFITCDNSSLTNPEVEPVAHLAAHFLFAQLSNEYTKTMQASIDADAVNWSAQNVSYFTKSQDELKRYQAFISANYRPGSARVSIPTHSRRRSIFGF